MQKFRADVSMKLVDVAGMVLSLHHHMILRACFPVGSKSTEEYARVVVRRHSGKTGVSIQVFGEQAIV